VRAFFASTPGLVVPSKRAASAALDGVHDYASAADAAPNHDISYQGCSQKTLAPLATVLLQLTRQNKQARRLLSSGAMDRGMPVTATNDEVLHGRFRLDEELRVARQFVDLLDVGPGVRLDVVERAPVADD